MTATIEDIFGLNNKDSDCPDDYLAMLTAFGQEKAKKDGFHIRSVIRKDWSTKPLDFSDPLSLLENQVCFAVFHSSYPDKILCLTETYELAMYFLIVCEYHHQRVDSIINDALETRRDLCNLFSEVFDLKNRLKQEIRDAP